MKLPIDPIAIDPNFRPGTCITTKNWGGFAHLNSSLSIHIDFVCESFVNSLSLEKGGCCCCLSFFDSKYGVFVKKHMASGVSSVKLKQADILVGRRNASRIVIKISRKRFTSFVPRRVGRFSWLEQMH